MLKSGGVDKFSIAERITSLSKEEQTHLSSQYLQQWTLVEKLLMEIRFCEKFMKQRGFDILLEDEFISLIPMNNPDFEALKKNKDVVHLDLESILKSSSSYLAKNLALIALVRQGKFNEDWHENLRMLFYNQGRLLVEALALFVSWQWRNLFSLGLRRRYAPSIDTDHLLGLIEEFPQMKSWLTLTLLILNPNKINALGDEVKTVLEKVREEAIQSDDFDLRLSWLLYLEDPSKLELEFESMAESEARNLVRLELASLGSPLCFKNFSTLPIEVKDRVLQSYRGEVKDELKKELLIELRNNKDALGAKILRLVGDQLSEEESLEFLTALDPEKAENLLLELLLKKNFLGVEAVFEKAIELNLVAKLKDHFTRKAREEKLGAALLAKSLAEADVKNEELVTSLLRISEVVLKAHYDLNLLKEMTQIAWSPKCSKGLRSEAFWCLKRSQKGPRDVQLGLPLSFEPEAIEALFGSKEHFLECLFEAMVNPEFLSETNLIGFVDQVLDGAKSLDLNTYLNDSEREVLVDKLFVVLRSKTWAMYQRTCASLIANIVKASANPLELKKRILELLDTEPELHSECQLTLKSVIS